MGTLAIGLVADSAELKAALGDAGKSLSSLSDKMGDTGKSANSMSSTIKAAMEKIGEALNATMSKLAKDGFGASSATEALTAGLSKLAGVDLGPAVELVDKIKENLLELDNLSKVTGVSAGTFTQLKDSMEAVGVPSDKLEDQLVSLREAMGKVQGGSKEDKEAFEKLGISTEGWGKKIPPMLPILAQLADRFHTGRISAKDLENAHKLLGDQYEKTIAYLKRGSGALLEEMRAHREHGQAVEDSITSAKELQREEAALAEKLQLILLPAFRFVVAAVQQVVAAFISFKGVLTNVGTLVTGVVRLIIDGFNLAATVVASIFAHWKDLLRGHFSSVASDAKGAFDKIQVDFNNTMAGMVKTANDTDKELDAFFNHQLSSATDNDNKHTGVIRAGTKKREVITLEARKNLIKQTKDTGHEIEIDWRTSLARMGPDTGAVIKVIGDLLVGMPAPLPPALQKVASKSQQIMQTAAQNMAKSFSSAIRGMIDGTQTLGQAFAKIGQQMLSSMEDMLQTMLTQWLETHIMQLLIHTQTKQGEIVVDKTASAEKQAINMQDHLKNIFMAAKEAGANAWKSMSAINPVLGALAAAAAFAGVMAFGAMGSAEGGQYLVPGPQLTMLHPQEMVLPAGLAGRMRDVIESGGGGGAGAVHVHMNVNAIDSSSFKDTLGRHGHMIGELVTKAMKRKGMK